MTKIGPYQVVEALHRGSRPLFKVKAADGRLLALKSIAVEGLSAEMRERFNREAEICRTLDHPNLVRVYDAGEADGVLYQAMDLLVGSDLSNVLASRRQFTWQEKLSIMEQVSDGLQFAHERHLVHRDIKPANIFLEDSGRVRLLDFGMARVAASQLTKAGTTLGTLNYMSPEQIRGARCTSAADVFSAGIVFYQLASGSHPFSARDRSLAQVVSAIVFETPPKLSELAPGAPEGLEFLLNKAMEKAPEARFQSAGELRQALALCRITLELAATAPPAPSPQAPASPAPRPGAAVDGEKTQVLHRPASSPVSPDNQKTLAFVRPPSMLQPAPKPASGPKAPPPLSSVQPPALSGVKPPAASGAVTPRFRYCPSCTFANAPSAGICGGCGLPLGNTPEEKPANKPWGLYSAIGIAVLLAIALAVVLLVKR